MSDIEFVIEAPQSTRQNKKRPRLVTSCDHCRVKKIKCVQQPPAAKCEACATARIPCLYRDREQYFAERTRMLSGSTSAPRDASPSDPPRAQLSAIGATSPFHGRISPSAHSPQSSISSAASSDRSISPAYMSHLDLNSMDLAPFQGFSSGMGTRGIPTGWEDPSQAYQWGASHSPPDIRSGTTLHTPPPVSSSSTASLTSLFDPADKTQPHPNLMMEFIRVFFDKLGMTYPFLSSESICDQFLHHRLSPLLANSIAASAARFSNVLEIQHVGPANAADVYCQMAKSLVPLNSSPASIDAAHSLILLSWAEYHRGRLAAFSSCARTALRLATELGITSNSFLDMARILDSRTASIFEATVRAIQQLESTLLQVPVAATAHPTASSAFLPAGRSGSTWGQARSSPPS